MSDNYEPTASSIQQFRQIWSETLFVLLWRSTLRGRPESSLPGSHGIFRKLDFFCTPRIQNTHNWFFEYVGCSDDFLTMTNRFQFRPSMMPAAVAHQVVTAIYCSKTMKKPLKSWISIKSGAWGMAGGVLIFLGNPRCGKKLKTGPKIRTRPTSGEDISELRRSWNKNWISRIAYSTSTFTWATF